MPTAEKSILRMTTSGSVDDGKSTLIGRLLFESKCIYEDQLSAAERTTQRRGSKNVDLSLLLDGLAAEREQGITIDVAYRYFETPRRKFIIADTPGHEQYTRNMVTGASTAQLAVILIDARHGVVTQSKRHGFLISLLQIPHLVVAINKMDLVDYSQEVYESIVADYMQFSDKLDVHDITYIPVSALEGENVTEPSKKMPWYEGPSMLHYLETVQVGADRNLVDFRFPVQYVIRPNQDFRGYAGRVSSGTIRRGEEIAVLPSGKKSRVRSIVTYDGELDEAAEAQAVVLQLDNEIDVSRGEMIVRPNNVPTVANRFEAILCWMHENKLSQPTAYYLKHTTQTVRAYVNRLFYKIDVNTLHREDTDTLELNEIGRVELRTAKPLFFDSYAINQTTGSFILIDPVTNITVGAGIIRSTSRTVGDVVGERPETARQQISTNVTWEAESVSREAREERNGHKAAVLWLTGLSGSGKSTLAKEIERRLFDQGCRTMLLDGDNVRHGLCGDLGFGDRDRTENIRRVAEVAKLFFDNGSLALCTFISPYRQDRDFARGLLPHGRFVEIHVKCDLETCKQRDPKGLYKKAINGEIKEFTGISAPYEEPQSAEVTLDTSELSIEQSVDKVIEYLRDQGIVGGGSHSG